MKLNLEVPSRCLVSSINGLGTPSRGTMDYGQSIVRPD